MALSSDPRKRARQLANRRDAPPPERGNKRAVKHGAKAQPEPRRQAALEAQIRDALPVRGADGEAPVHDLIAVRLLAITLCRLESCAAYVSQHGQFFKGGRVRPAVELEDKLIARAQKLAAELGMTPRSRVALGVDLVHAQASLAQLMSDADAGGTGTSRRTRQRPDDIEATVVDDGA
jgi:hypothetical protein